MNDPWVRGCHGSWIQSPQSQGVHSLRVFDFIVDEERVWDIDKLESLLLDDMVQAILDTPLFAEVQNDKIVWMMERNGTYTVKIGYKLAMMELLHTDRFHVEGCFILVFGCQTLITFEPFKPVISYFFLGREKVSKTLENRGPGVVFAMGRC